MIATLPANGVGNKAYYYDQYGNKYYINSHGQKVYAEDSNFYIGYNSNTGGSAEINGIGINQNGPYINGNNLTIGTGYTQQPQINKPVAYTANAAKTASSIKQGGMTKQEIQDFNAKHPNESAWRQS